MKTIFLSLTAISILFVACTNEGPNKTETDSTTLVVNSGQETVNSNMPANQILVDYLKVKNALANDNDKAAAEAAVELTASFESVDKTAFNAEQSQVFTDLEADAIEHAEHIAANAGNLVHQREHFETLSEEVYELVKVTGAGQKLYYTNCPMYNKNKGANWLSETKEVKNPYFGQAMLSCGSVTEELN